MTVSDALTYIRLGLDKTSSLTTPSFEDEELVYWLNVAQQRWVKTKFSGNNIYKADYNDMQKRISDFKNLIVNIDDTTPGTTYQDFEAGTVAVVDFTDIFSESYEDVDLTTWQAVGKLLFYLDSKSVVTRAESYDVYAPRTTGLVQNVDIVAEDASKYLSTLYNSPYFERPVCFIDGNNLVVITDDYSTISTVWIRYLRYPKELDLVFNNTRQTTTIELPEYAAQEIVDLAVTILIENIESQRIQTQPIIAANNE